MPQMSAQLLDPESLLGLEAGHWLRLANGQRTIAQVVPTGESNDTEQLWKREEERLQAVERLVAIMHKGFDLGEGRVEDRASRTEDDRLAALDRSPA